MHREPVERTDGSAAPSEYRYRVEKPKGIGFTGRKEAMLESAGVAGLDDGAADGWAQKFGGLKRAHSFGDISEAEYSHEVYSVYHDELDLDYRDEYFRESGRGGMMKSVGFNRFDEYEYREYVPDAQGEL